MKELVQLLAAVVIAVSCFAQAPVRPVVISKPEVEGQVTVVEVRPHFVTAIRMPEAVNSIAIGDPKLFQVEHSPDEPTVVFVKSLTSEPTESNLLISTGGGHETSLLLVSHGVDSQSVDFVVKYQRAGSFLIEPDYPAELIGETIPAAQAEDQAADKFGAAASSAVSLKPVSLTRGSPPGVSAGEARPGTLDALLTRQEHSPLPTLYGEHPGIENPGGDRSSRRVERVALVHDGLHIDSL